MWRNRMCMSCKEGNIERTICIPWEAMHLYDPPHNPSGQGAKPVLICHSSLDLFAIACSTTYWCPSRKHPLPSSEHFSGMRENRKIKHCAHDCNKLGRLGGPAGKSRDDRMTGQSCYPDVTRCQMTKTSEGRGANAFVLLQRDTDRPGGWFHA